MTTYRLLVIAALAAAALAVYLTMRPAQRAAVLPRFTPGVANAAITQANIGETVCTHGWTRTVRPSTTYTNALKVKQMRRYGEIEPPSQYQEDHLISLELGGDPTDQRNLWPEPYPRAAEMDQIENELNAQLCSGRLTLQEAQDRESEIKHTQG